MNALSTHEIEWPPTYKIKKHRRARHIKLRVSKIHGLEITVPYRLSPREIPDVLEKNKNWIMKQLAQAQSQPIAALPEQIIFPSLNETWPIQYLASDTKLTLFERPTREVVLMGKTSNEAGCKKLLLTWVKQQAQRCLLVQLKKISEKTQLLYQTVTIRDQKTRWGSCTSKKNISLNYKLIFLPTPLMENIIIHELCHTVHLNHSDQFWNLVAKFDPAWQEHRRELRKADKFIPAWI